jgi:hypothetical protein
MINRKALGVIAGAVLVLGFILALVPTSVSGRDVLISGGDVVGCGSALSPDPKEAYSADIADVFRDVLADRDADRDGGFRALCEDRVTTQRLISFPIAGVAALAMLYLLGTRQPTRAQPTPGDAVRAQSNDGNVVA